jgi:cellobiose-specific phosphotransferase system component IIC
MILFDHEPPYLIERSIIVDPYDPSFSLVLILTGLILCLACLGLIYYSEVKRMSDKFLGKWFGMAVNAAVWVVLVSLMAMYYPSLDYWMYNTMGLPPNYTGLTNYWGYGRIHIVSVLFTLGVVAAAILSPVLTALLVKAAEWLVTQVRDQAAGHVANES